MSRVRDNDQVRAALQLLAERFASVDNDGPRAYASFLADDGDEETAARLRQEAVTVVRTFIEKV